MERVKQIDDVDIEVLLKPHNITLCTMEDLHPKMDEYR